MISPVAIQKLREILLKRNVILDDLELQQFGEFVLTMGCEVLKFKEKSCYNEEATQEIIGQICKQS